MRSLRRRFLLWLCREEIDAAVEIERAQCAFGLKLHTESAYAMGKRDGFNQAMDEVDKAMRERMGGGDDVWRPEDLARARKGSLH